MTHTLEQLQSMQDAFQLDRPVMRIADDLPHLFHLMRQEVDEAEAEIGNEKIRTELADIGILLLTMASRAGVNLGDEIAEKMARNILKYEAKDFQDGEYLDKVISSKKRWLAEKGEEWFYE